MKFLPEKYHLNLVGPFENEGMHFERDLEYLNKLKREIINNGLTERVKIMNNFIDNPEKYYESSDIFVLPSINEGLGTTLLEAIASRRPVVCNNLYNVFGEYVEDKKNGFLVELDPKQWARKIIDCELLDYKELEIASKKISRCASEDLIILKYNDEILKILENENSNS